MARRPDSKKTQDLYNVVRRYPGRKRSFLARILNWHRQKVERTLVYAEETNLLLYEDEDGHLWPYSEE